MRRILGIAIALCTCLLIATSSPAASPDNAESLVAKAHPLPPALARWQDPNNSGDYFDRVQELDIGYLIWSEFPVKIYLENLEESDAPPDSFQAKALQAWQKQVLAAVQSWNAYFPLVRVDNPEKADITIWRRRPPLRLSPTREILPARSAEARYELYARERVDAPAILSHRFTIFLSPTQVGEYIQSAASHEIGHALGIWGHSPLETDTMYFSQVRRPGPISARDINTLKRVYQQPTHLGWPLVD
ncbi:MAG: peptidase [Oscillatoria sp. SIO1A7]|nr:peptidase [Oscillatoria sp. SIO1A7]